MQDDKSQTLSVMLLALGIIIALFNPKLTAIFQPFAMTALFFVIILSVVSFADNKRQSLMSIDRKTWLISGWQQIVLPGLVLALGILAELPTHIVTMMIVTACAGSLFASPMMAGLLNLDRNQTVKSMIVSTLWTPVSLYVFLSLLYESGVQLDVSIYAQRAVVFLVVPFIFLLIYRIITRRLPEAAVEKFESGSRWGSVIALLIFGMGVVHPVAENLHTQPFTILLYLVIVSVLSFGMFLLTTIIFYRLGSKAALTAGVINGFRNVGLCMALVSDMLAPDLTLYVGVSMLPIFLAPAIIKLVTMQQRRLMQDAVAA